MQMVDLREFNMRSVCLLNNTPVTYIANQRLITISQRNSAHYVLVHRPALLAFITGILEHTISDIKN